MKQLQVASYKLQVTSIRKLVLSLFLLAAGCLLLVSSVYADTVYTVKRGDTLHSISRKFDVSIREIKSANNLTSNRIKAGAKLTIPVESHAAENLEGTSEETSADAVVASPLPLEFADTVYTVKRGDTLHSISRKFDVSIREIKSANNLTSNRIKAGAKLTIPANERTGRTLDSTAIRAPLSQEEIKKLSKSEDLLELDIRDRIILFAKKMLGLPYRFGGNSFSGIDCSAYVQKVFRLAGIDLPRTAREQFRAGESISKEELSIGDLVFFRTYASFPSHVGIYIGDNSFIHTSRRNRKVTITSLDTPFFLRRFIGAKRLIPEGEMR